MKLLSFIDGVLTILMGVWLGLCILTQFPQAICQHARRWDLFHILPSWNFFAPHPLVSDYHLLYRDHLPDGTHTDWTEVALSQPRMLLLVGLWNPEKRQGKAFIDLVADLLKQEHTEDDTSIQLSVAYLMLLNFVTHQPHQSGGTHTQFLIMKFAGSTSTEEPTVLLLSGVHQL